MSCKTHGMSFTPEYTAWIDIKSRTNNPKHRRYKDYGGRGIIVCDRWLHSFQNFYEDVGKRPSKDHSIDRIDNDKGYFPENCKWSTREEQLLNRRKKKGSSKYRGVCRHGKNWSTTLYLGKGKRLRLGTYKTQEEAAQVYNDKIIELGLNKVLNIIEIN